MRHALISALVVGTQCIVVQAHAEPSSAVRFLFQEKVSLMDWGLFQAQERLNVTSTEFLGMPGTQHGSARYEWATNRIIVEAMLMPGRAGTPTQVRDTCRRGLRAMRAIFGINADTGRVEESSWHVAQLFQSNAYELVDAPKNLSDEIEQIMELKMRVMSPSGNGGYSTAIMCSGRLLSTEVLFAD